LHRFIAFLSITKSLYNLASFTQPEATVLYIILFTLISLTAVAADDLR